jgi:4-hydroxy-3-polyprenylbenzoate decarboxylase
MVHDGDGGRYICTWHFVVAKDLDTPTINWGMYRQMLFDEKTMVGPVLPFSDMGKMFYNKYAPKGIPMPFATVISPDPLSAIASCAPAAIPEDEFTSLLMGEPVEVVKCVTCDLYVPAHAEIIIEGVILPGVTIEEAPFGEYTGYRTSPRDNRTVYRVKAITMRKKPIMGVSNMGVPTDEGQLLRSFSLGLEMERMLRDQGIPVTGVYMLPESTHHMVVVGVKPIYANVATQIGQLVFGSKLGPWFHMVVVVDDTTDIYNKDEIIHALSTRCHPVTGIRVEPRGVGTPLNPYASPEERKFGRAPKVIFDCLWPPEWPTSEVPIKVSFNNVYPKEIQEKVLAKWNQYGFKD